MPKWCQFRAKPGVDPSCPMLPEPGGDLCPRHAFLANLKAEEKDKKESAKAQAEAAGVKGRMPANKLELLKRGYHFLGEGTCHDCGEAVEWWHTPAGRRAPFKPMPQDYSPAAIHFITCKRSTGYRGAA